MGSLSPYSETDAAEIRRRYVVDRADGRPLLLGWSDCPGCSHPLVTRKTGEMELNDQSVRCRFFVDCARCRKSLSIEDEFEWGP